MKNIGRLTTTRIQEQKANTKTIKLVSAQKQ